MLFTEKLQVQQEEEVGTVISFRNPRVCQQDPAQRLQVFHGEKQKEEDAIPSRRQIHWYIN